MVSEVAREGIFAINKPCGHSSAAIVRECQLAFNPSRFFQPVVAAAQKELMADSNNRGRRLRKHRKSGNIKIGHAGTLDPLATGVLILGVGKATKALPQFLECAKSYETIVLFGASTDTYDRVGRVLTKRPYDHITRERVEKELDSFRGKNIQMPPLYSALKMDGKPLYEYAREGKPIPREIAGREVEVVELELVEWYEPGKHKHRWPTQEAGAAERNLAEQVWSIKKQQESSQKLTPEEKEVDDQAIAAHETFKRKFEERQDELIRDAPSKRSRHSKEPPMMSGALGQLPQKGSNSEPVKGTNLIAEVDENTPPPWNDEGPPAAKIRMTVTSGFYVRSFCHDLGVKVGSAGLMAELCRTRQSDFTVGGLNCLEYEDLHKGEAVWGSQIADMLARWNGEPEGQYRDLQTSQPGSPQAKGKKPSQSPDRGQGGSSAGPDKRRHSPSRDGSSPPRKVAATAPESALKPVRKTGDSQRSEDEKSWNGIDD